MGDYDELQGHDPIAEEAIDKGSVQKDTASKPEPEAKPSKSDS